MGLHRDGRSSQYSLTPISVTRHLLRTHMTGGKLLILRDELVRLVPGTGLLTADT